MKIDHTTYLGSTLERDTKDVLPETKEIFKRLIAKKGEQLIPRSNVHMNWVVDDGNVSAVNFTIFELPAWAIYCGMGNGASQKLKQLLKESPIGRFVPMSNFFILSVPIGDSAFQYPVENMVIGDVALYVWDAIYTQKTTTR